LLLLGEAIIQIVVSHTNTNIDAYAKVTLSFLVILNIGNIYYKQQRVWVEKYAASNIDKPYSFLWVTLHLFLATSILLFALALKLVFTDKVILFYVILVTSFFHDVNAMNFVLC
jgi:low temperature requirement protein LtrA